ncbi:argininosuccinate lyase [Paraherbaspirillum soli]|uniref:Argininosuccinate lyase n=1 Tax=Paraherbaspirillum soli TaxID=631222 RepID=A0ABW0MBE7_9BURK
MDATTKRVLDTVNSSVDFDYRLAQADVACTSAHVAMLARQGILSGEDSEVLLAGLKQIGVDIDEGSFICKPELEDIHMNVEAELERHVGMMAGKIGAARGRNDLAVTALRMWIRDKCDEVLGKLFELIAAFVEQAEQHARTVMPGMTHLQAAQPVSFGHLCLAYAEMFFRDARRFGQVREWLNESPLGACALAGTSFNIDREFTAVQLGFAQPTANSIDSVADRDFVLDFLGACATASIHASRFAEDVVIWITPQFGFLSLPDFLAGRSAIMPHKRNPDALELVRAKSGRIVGNLNTVQIVLKGLTMSYCRDMQEDKEATFDSADAICLSLDVLRLVVEHLTVHEDAMRTAANTGFTTSTDFADWLTREKHIPFRQAHHMMSSLVDLAQKSGCTLAELPPATRAQVDERLGAPDWPQFSADESISSRTSHGGTAPSRILQAAQHMTRRVSDLQHVHNSGKGQHR